MFSSSCRPETPSVKFWTLDKIGCGALMTTNLLIFTHTVEELSVSKKVKIAVPNFQQEFYLLWRKTCMYRSLFPLADETLTTIVDLKLTLLRTKYWSHIFRDLLFWRVTDTFFQKPTFGRFSLVLRFTSFEYHQRHYTKHCNVGYNFNKTSITPNMIS